MTYHSHQRSPNYKQRNPLTRSATRFEKIEMLKALRKFRRQNCLVINHKAWPLPQDVQKKLDAICQSVSE